MKTGNRLTLLSAFFAALAVIVLFSGPVHAVDDGARAYWKGRAGTQAFSFQYLRWDIGASAAQQFDPSHYIYPNADAEASVFVANWARHFTLLNRPSSFSAILIGGSVDVDFNPNAIPKEFLPPDTEPGISNSFSQSSSGFADPAMQLDVNLFGTPPLRSNVDLLNYEPTLTLDAAVMVGVPIGEYDGDMMVNLGLNRWYGRFALPLKYHFGVFDRGHMSSFELTPSVWLFAENDDFVGQKMENDPLWQVEAHLTHDFTAGFFASLDMLYRSGFQSKIDGEEVGEELDIGNLGFTLNYQVTANFTVRTSYMSNLFGDDGLDNSILRMQFVWAWHPQDENAKRLKQGH